MMHHGNISYIGRNEDALLIDSPDYSIIKSKNIDLENAISRLIPTWRERGDYQGMACVKVDCSYVKHSDRSLNINIFEMKPNHFFILPGKFTEAPFLIDTLISCIYPKLSLSDSNKCIARRPCDEF